MREADALARLILRAGAAEKIENALVILVADSAAVILNLDQNRAAAVRSGANGNPRRPAGRTIFHGIVDEIAEYLFEGEPVGDQRSAAAARC